MPTAIVQKKIDHVSAMRRAAKALIDAERALAAQFEEYTALGWDADDLDEGCGKGSGNEGLTGADMVAVYTTFGNLTSFMAAGNATNLYKVVA